jgi:hypothetical protein
MMEDGTAHCTLSYSPVGTEVKTTCHRPLERSEQVDTVATLLARRKCVYLSVSLDVSFLAQGTYKGMPLPLFLER